MLNARSRLVLLFLLACLFYASCAAEGPPRPPRIERPARITDLAAIQTGSKLRVTFGFPQLSTDGERLTKPAEADVYLQITGAGKTPGIPSAGGLPWKQVTKSKSPVMEYQLTPAQFNRSIGSIFSFAVVTFTRGFRGRERRSDISNIARVKLLNVSPPIENLRAVQTPSCIRLTWSQPDRGLGEGPLPPIKGYRIYRSEGGTPAGSAGHEISTGRFIPAGPSKAAVPEAPITIRTGDVTSYCDIHFQYNQRYVYGVRAVFTQNGYTAETADSKVAAITPRNIFPPPPPTQLEAVSTTSSLELIWEPGSSNQVEGYNIYREGPNGRVLRLNPAPLLAAHFADRKIQRGVRYLYWVTAVNSAGIESVPSNRVVGDTP